MVYCLDLLINCIEENLKFNFNDLEVVLAVQSISSENLWWLSSLYIGVDCKKCSRLTLILNRLVVLVNQIAVFGVSSGVSQVLIWVHNKRDSDLGFTSGLGLLF